jgi:polyhydroxybutyrate depolymerase
MRTRVFSNAVALLLTAAMACGAGYAETIKLPSGRQYIADLPSSGGKNAPLLIVFHGGALTGASVRKYSGLSEPANKRGYVVIYPTGSGKMGILPTWNAGTCCGYAVAQNIDDVGYTATLIADAAQRFGINTHRVFLTGISNGAEMSFRVAAERPDLVAGIAPISGPLATVSADLKGPVPVVDFHGDADGFAKYGGGEGKVSKVMFRSVPETLAIWAKENGVSPTPTITKLPDIADDGTAVERYDFGPGLAPLVHYRIIGGGHNWPGRKSIGYFGTATKDIDADQIMLDFFDRLPDKHNT